MSASEVVETFESVERKRRDFARALSTFRGKGGRYHNPAPPLPDEKYRGCEVLADRLVEERCIGRPSGVGEFGHCWQPPKWSASVKPQSRAVRSNLRQATSRVRIRAENLRRPITWGEV